jgi:hypothetical protein
LVFTEQVLCILRQQLSFCSSLLSGLTSAHRQSRQPSNAQGISVTQMYAQGQHFMSPRGCFFTSVSPCVFSCSGEAAEGRPVCRSTPDTCWTECMKLCCLLCLIQYALQEAQQGSRGSRLAAELLPGCVHKGGDRHCTALLWNERVLKHFSCRLLHSMQPQRQAMARWCNDKVMPC